MQDITGPLAVGLHGPARVKVFGHSEIPTPMYPEMEVLQSSCKLRVSKKIGYLGIYDVSKPEAQIMTSPSCD